MDPLEFEKRTREKRCIEAEKKNLVGPEGKIGTILKYMGHEIVEHTVGDASMFDGDSNSVLGIMYSSTPGVNAWLLDEPPEEAKNAVDMTSSMPTMMARDALGNEIPEPEGEEWTTRKYIEDFRTKTIGMCWDGMDVGVHMEIKYLEESQTLSVRWQGYLVYKEVAGDLRLYLPADEWESKVNHFYEQAKPRGLAVRKRAEEARKEEEEKIRKGFLRKTLERWGVIK